MFLIALLGDTGNDCICFFHLESFKADVEMHQDEWDVRRVLIGSWDKDLKTRTTQKDGTCSRILSEGAPCHVDEALYSFRKQPPLIHGTFGRSPVL